MQSRFGVLLKRQARIVRSLPLVALAGLAIAFAGSMALFAIVDEVVLATPTGVAAPHDLSRVLIRSPRDAVGITKVAPVISYPEFSYLQRRLANVQLAAYCISQLRIEIAGENRDVQAAIVSPGFFEIVGAREAWSRTIERPIQTGIAVRPELWALLTKRSATPVIRVSGRELRVVAIASAPFHGVDPEWTDIWMPAEIAAELGFVAPLSNSNTRAWSILLRAAVGQSQIAVASATRAAIADYDRSAGAKPDDIRTARFAPLSEGRYETSLRRRQLLLSGLSFIGVSIVLVAWSSAVVLLLMRLVNREVEIATRLALGASRGSLFIENLSESFALQGVAFLLGGGLAIAGIAAADGLHSRLLWRVSPTSLGSFALALLVLGSVLCAIPTFFLTQRVEVASVLRGRAGRHGMGGVIKRLCSALLILQTAAAIALFVAAGRLASNVRQASKLHFGFDPANTFAVRRRGDKGTAAPSSGASLQHAIEQWDGVQSTAWGTGAPLLSSVETSFLTPGIDGRPSEMISVLTNTVQAAYFDVLRIRLKEGRGFRESDDERAIVVDPAFVRAFGWSRAPLGQCVIINAQSSKCHILVGVVDTTRYLGVWESPAPTVYYLRPRYEMTEVVSNADVLLVRVAAERSAPIDRLYARVRAAGDDPTMYSIQSLEELRDAQTQRWRIGAMVCSGAAIALLFISVVGLSNLVTFEVARQRRDIGIRAALGAPKHRVILNVAKGPVLSGIGGIVLGFVSGLALSRLTSEWSREITQAIDPIIGAGLVGAGIAIVVSAIWPAVRATEIHPMEAIRSD